MMVANSSNLIITIRPANQRNPFHYPKQSHQQIAAQQQSTLNQPNHHNHGSHKLNHHTKISHSKSENNLSHHAHSLKLSNQHAKRDSNQRIPLQTNENTLSSNQRSESPIDKPSYYYLDSFVKLAPGEDTDDDDEEEDEVKVHTGGVEAINLTNNNKDQQHHNKVVVESNRSDH